MPDDYRTACRLMLPDIAEAEMGAVKKLKEDPDTLIRHPQLFKAIKQGAGVDLQDTESGKKQITINIENFRQEYWSRPENQPDAIEGEVMENEK